MIQESFTNLRYFLQMSIFRSYIAPLLAVLIFSLALVAVSARIFLPSDMAAPAPVEEKPEVGIVIDGGNFSLSSLYAPYFANEIF
jgi:hypothetical protein